MSLYGYGYTGFGQGAGTEGPGYVQQYTVEQVGPLAPILCGPRPFAANPAEQMGLFSLGPWEERTLPASIAQAFTEITAKIDTSNAGLLRPVPSVPRAQWATYASPDLAVAQERTWSTLQAPLFQTGTQYRLIEVAHRYDDWLRYGIMPNVPGERARVVLPIADLKARWKAGLSGRLPDVSQDPAFHLVLDQAHELAHIVQQLRRPAGVVLRTIETVPGGSDPEVLTLEQEQTLAWMWTSEATGMCPAGWTPAARTVYREHPEVLARADWLLGQIQAAASDYHNALSAALIPVEPEIPPEPLERRPLTVVLMLGVAAVGTMWAARRLGWLRGGGRRRRAPRTAALPAFGGRAHPRRGERVADWRPIGRS